MMQQHGDEEQHFMPQSEESSQRGFSIFGHEAAGWGFTTKKPSNNML
jgi:hypothetical protein